jgi:hypothetical protein
VVIFCWFKYLDLGLVVFFKRQFSEGEAGWVGVFELGDSLIGWECIFGDFC